MKLYFFDIDGNLLFVPTKFYMEDIKTGRIKTFVAKDSYYISINKDILGLRYQKSLAHSMRNFRGKNGDKILLQDIKKTEFGPSWSDFVECINSGSVLAVITGRGNSINCLKKAFKGLILKNTNGILMEQFVEHVKDNPIFNKRVLEQKVILKSNLDVVSFYIDNCCNFYSKSSKETKKELNITEKAEMSQYKLLAIKNLEKKIVKDIRDIKKMGILINETINFGFSDDEIPNCKIVKKYFNKKGDKIFKRYVYFTGNGDKTVI